MAGPALPWDSLSGLRPRACVCVGGGYSREEVKAEALARGIAFTADAIVSPVQLAAGLAGCAPERVLGPEARQEALRLLLGERRIVAYLPELKRLRRQRGFFKRLDRALQSGRKAFAHDDELEVFEARLAERFGAAPLRDELRRLARAYEAWLDGKNLWDEPRVLRAAVHRLGERWPTRWQPEKIAVLSARAPESLEREFWDAVARWVTLVNFGPQPGALNCATWAWRRWHTLDDAADALADAVSLDDIVLLPDRPAVRRSLMRALAGRGVPLADARDPTRLRWDEEAKRALLPLEVVGGGFEREAVAGWLHAEGVRGFEGEVAARGLRLGLMGYAGGKLAAAHERLSALERELGGKQTCAELGRAHAAHLAARGFAAWVAPFFEAQWQGLADDLALVDRASRRAPALYWLERLTARLDGASPPAERVKVAEGLRLYRLQQAAFIPWAEHERPVGRIWVFGLPPDWLSGDGASDGCGDYWYGPREREALAADFAVRSPMRAAEERAAVLKEWLALAAETVFVDAEYDGDGRERDTIRPALRMLAPEAAALEPETWGSDPRFAPSYGICRSEPPVEVALPPLVPQPGESAVTVRATELDRYSRCPFQALAYHRWKLADLREPEPELWPDVRGNILHEAVRLIVGEGRSPAEALEEAWRNKPPLGLIRSPRIIAYARARLLKTLETFCEQEREYATRSGTQAVNLEDLKLRADFGDVAVIGNPDRVDLARPEPGVEGIFVIDYKTSSDVPKGSDMLERGYRLQLPYYALAAARTLGKPALGVQFVELTQRGGRGRGVFFKRYNGKEQGKITSVGARSASLIDAAPEDVWPRFEERVSQEAHAYASGRLDARPKFAEECRKCRIADLCGYRRRVARGESARGEPE